MCGVRCGDETTRSREMVGAKGCGRMSGEGESRGPLCSALRLDRGMYMYVCASGDDDDGDDGVMVRTREREGDRGRR